MSQDIAPLVTPIHSALSSPLLYFGRDLQDTGSITLNITQQEILQKLLSNKKGLFSKPKSFYIHGKTGCGKTTVMENYLLQLYEKNKDAKFLAMHFHDYLLDITKLLTKNSTEKIVKEIAKNIDILCFDEFFIEAIADAKILYDILSVLIKNGVSIVLTSNFAPQELYANGFNREIMFPVFSNFLEEKMEVIYVQNTPDYRTNTLKRHAHIAFETLQEFASAFNVKPIMAKEMLEVDSNHTVQISGRFDDGIILTHKHIFKTHSSIKDYRKLARTFKHIHISNMQYFTQENEDEAIRFRNFIDILYTRGMVFSFDGQNSINIFEDKMLENIKFKRCQSRLHEMQTNDYIFSETKHFKRQLTVNSARFFDKLFVQML